MVVFVFNGNYPLQLGASCGCLNKLYVNYFCFQSESCLIFSKGCLLAALLNCFEWKTRLFSFFASVFSHIAYPPMYSISCLICTHLRIYSINFHKTHTSILVRSSSDVLTHALLLDSWLLRSYHKGPEGTGLTWFCFKNQYVGLTPSPNDDLPLVYCTVRHCTDRISSRFYQFRPRDVTS